MENGLTGTYVQLGGKAGPVSWLARYHQFEQETQGDACGSEFDLLLSMPFTNELTGLIKYAGYAAGSANTLEDHTAADKSVTWVRLDYEF